MSPGGVSTGAASISTPNAAPHEEGGGGHDGGVGETHDMTRSHSDSSVAHRAAASPSPFSGILSSPSPLRGRYLCNVYLLVQCVLVYLLVQCVLSQAHLTSHTLPHTHTLRQHSHFFLARA